MENDFTPRSLLRSNIVFLLLGLWLMFLLAIILIVAMTPITPSEVNEILVEHPPQSSFRIIQWISELMMILQ